MVIGTKEEFEKIITNPRKYRKKVLSGDYEITYDYPEKYAALVKAMKIKSRKERIIFIYDHACDTIDRYNEENGLLCSFHQGRCLAAEKGGRVNGCCYRCRYQSSKGCPSKNLTCKFYFCTRFLKEKPSPLKFEDFPEFKLLSKLQQEIIKTNAYCKREIFIRLLLWDNFIAFYIYSAAKIVNLILGEWKNRRLS